MDYLSRLEKIRGFLDGLTLDEINTLRCELSQREQEHKRIRGVQLAEQFELDESELAYLQKGSRVKAIMALTRRCCISIAEARLVVEQYEGMGR